ncbi:MAG TPA: T9SS type A sorting domain-containing protein [Bacteroidetes bacterium]|nr:T9SS type A sorting domain-containing protein [Bacteroidota bacterium]
MKSILLSLFLFPPFFLASQIQELLPKNYEGLPINGGGGWAALPIDLDGDGDMDFIALRSHEYDEVYINNGNGNFTRKPEMQNWQIPGGSYDFAFADFNADGKDDILLGRGPASGSCGTMLDGHDMLLIRDSADGLVEASGNLPGGASAFCLLTWPINTVNYTMGVATGDFDHDGIPDIVMANGGVIYQINIALMKPLECQVNPLCSDYVNWSFKNNLYLGRPDGTISGMPQDGVFDYVDVSEESGIGAAISLSTDVAVADFDGDGWDDVFVANFHHEKLTFGLPAGAVVSKLYLNNPGDPAHFRVSNGFPDTPFPATSVTASDFDKDGDMDLFLTMESRAFINIFQQYDIGSKLFLNDGTGHFSEAPDNVLPDFPPGCFRSMYDAHFTDINGDGWEDIYCSGVQSMLFLQNPNTHVFEDWTDHLPLQQSDLTPYSFHTYGSAVVDFNGDELPDFILVNTYEQGRVQAQTAGLQYLDVTENNLPPDGENNPAVAIADLDADGDPDIVAAIANDCDHLQSVHLQVGLHAEGHAAFVDRSDLFPSGGVVDDHTVAIADLDGNGFPDVLFAGVGKARLYKNNGNLIFEENSDEWLPGISGFQKINKALFIDIDKDGDKDLFLANGMLNGLAFDPAPNALFLWDAAAQKFELSDWLPPNNRVTTAADFADLNGDGWLDILSANEDGEMEIYMSQNAFPAAGPGYVLTVSDAFENNRSGNAKFADLNQDGRMDIVEVTSCCPGGNTGMQHFFYLNEGTFTGAAPDFSRHGFEENGFQTYALAITDLNADGHPDAVTGDRNDLRFYLWDENENALLDATTVFTGLNEISGLAMSAADLAVADMNRDGAADIYVARDNQDLLLYGDGEMTNTAENETENLPGFEIYPNPASNNIFIKWNGDFIGKNRKAEILSVQGQVLESFEFPAFREMKLDIGNSINNGVYFVRVYMEGRGFETKKIAVIR